MNEQQEGIARRLISNERWYWMPGMRGKSFEPGQRYDRPRVTMADSLGVVVHWSDPGRGVDSTTPGGCCLWGPWYVPDLLDAATVGCLLAMLIQADRTAVVMRATYTTYRLGEAVAHVLVGEWEWRDALRARIGWPGAGG